MARKPPSRKNGRSFNGKANNQNGIDGPQQVKGNRMKIVRGVDLGLVAKNVADSGLALDFSLADVPNSTDFTNVFDRYSLDKIELMFFYQNSPAATTNAFPTLLTSFDANDSSTPTTQNQVLERGNVQLESFTLSKNCIRKTFIPRTLAPATGALLALQMPLGTLVDTASPDQPYYGMKAFVQNYNTTSTPSGVLRLYAKYHFSFVTTK